ncbi:XAC2610-related protein [Flavisolibacter tropicus]|uniref:XAC2610-related protein n=1 Tax=Flavisolibacter tropicus TaxID=1492898 RepID=UPI00082D8E07|nr:hypothetical protein [Flavisolibacter tropicus]
MRKGYSRRLFYPTLLFLFSSLVVGQSYGQTSLQKKQAQTIISHLKSGDGNYEYRVGARDTLMDLNGDGYKDLLIEYYADSGTGLKNRVTVYLYDNIKKKFKPCEQLSSLANPTFYFDKKIVVGYYVGNGGGDATKLKWKGHRLDTLEHIDIDITIPDKVAIYTLTSTNYQTKKTSVKTLQVMALPKEYNYWSYQPLIKLETP